MACVQKCPDNTVEITSPQLVLGKICKKLDIFVDPGSEQVIELGTEAFPYRTFKAAASEILNFYSHSEYSVRVYVKDGYVEMDTFYFVNLTSVSILRHPEYESYNKRAQILVTKEPQSGISKKALFHLLNHADIDPAPKLEFPQSLEHINSELSKENFGFKIYRSSFEIQNIDLYGQELDYLIVPTYLQERELRLSKPLANLNNNIQLRFLLRRADFWLEFLALLGSFGFVGFGCLEVGMGKLGIFLGI